MKIGGNVVGGQYLSDATGADDKQRRNLDCHMYRSNKEQKYAKKSPKLQVELDGHENWWECRRGTVVVGCDRCR